MAVSILTDYTAGQGIRLAADNQKRRKFFLLFSLAVNLGMLFTFKYGDFLIRNINSLAGLKLPLTGLTLPLGISFYTFQTMSYTIDVYLGKAEAEKNIITFGAFVVLFPQLIAGPIVKYSDISAELKRRFWDPEKAEEGIRLFIMGLGSKVLIANNVGALWQEVDALPVESLSAAMAWLGIFAFGLQIYFDFSGYSLMAIGLGRLLGFTFPKNFDYPYVSRSITEFWRRWHMTLGSWFREYLYIPLGGSRVSAWKTWRNLFVVWACTGFWHGASWNFVLWGLFFFVVLVVEKRFLKGFLERYRVLSHLYVLTLLLFSWVLFAITDFSQLGLYFRQMFSGAGGSDWVYALRNYGVVLLSACFLATPALKNFWERHLARRKWATAVLLVGVLALSVAYLADASYNPFLYFRF